MVDSTAPDCPFDGEDGFVAPTPTVQAEPATVGALALVTGIVAQLDTVEAGFAALETRYKDVAIDCSTPQGMKEAKAARQVVRQPRYNAQNIVDAAKAPLNTMKAAIASQGDAFIRRVAAIEDPIDAQIKAQEKIDADRKEAEAKAKAAADEIVEQAINNVRNLALKAIDKSSIDIEASIDSLRDWDITLEMFGDRAGEAEQVKGQIVAQLSKMREAAALREAQAAELAAFRQQQEEAAELSRKQQAEEAQRAAAARKEEAEKLEKQRAEQAAQQRALDEQAAALRKQQDEFAATQRAEADRVAAIERKRLDDEAAAQRAKDERSAAVEHMISTLRDAPDLEGSSDRLAARVKAVEDFDVLREDFGDRFDEAVRVKAASLIELHAKIAVAVKDEKAEVDRLEQQRVEREAEAADEAYAKLLRDLAPAMKAALNSVLADAGYKHLSTMTREAIESVIANATGETE